MTSQFLRYAVVVAALPILCLAVMQNGAVALGEPVVVTQMGNDIELNSAPNGATLSTMGGDIHLGHAGGMTSLKTMGGDIRVDTAQAALRATTMGGDVRIVSARGPVDIKTQGGNLDVVAASDSVTAITAGGDINVALDGDASAKGAVQRIVALRSDGGNVVLHVPADFVGTIDATLVFSRRSDGRYDVAEPFGLSRSVTPQWVSTYGDAHKTIHVSGAVGHVTAARPGAKVTLTTSDGNIRIVRG